MSGIYRSAQEIRRSETIHTLGELAEEFLKEKAPTWGTPNLKLNTADLNTLIEYFSKDEDIKAITHLNLINYRDNILKNFPANRNTIPRLKDKQDSERWSIFRLGFYCHNIPTINNQAPDINGQGIVDYIDNNKYEDALC